MAETKKEVVAAPGASNTTRWPSEDRDAVIESSFAHGMPKTALAMIFKLAELVKEVGKTSCRKSSSV
jgi:hypothetical protein